jgi:hypothetical protein
VFSAPTRVEPIGEAPIPDDTENELSWSNTSAYQPQQSTDSSIEYIPVGSLDLLQRLLMGLQLFDVPTVYRLYMKIMNSWMFRNRETWNRGGKKKIPI